MNYENLKTEISEISEIANSVPEAFKEKCFEILLQYHLSQNYSTNTNPAQPDKIQTPEIKPPESTRLPIPSVVRVFIRKTNVTEDELNSVLMYEDGKVFFIKEPKTNVVGQGQIEWALLLALKNAYEKNEFIVDPEDVRSICKEKGFYDAANFSKNFKAQSNETLFKNLLVPQGEPQQLSDEGQIALGQLIKKMISNN